MFVFTLALHCAQASLEETKSCLTGVLNISYLLSLTPIQGINSYADVAQKLVVLFL